MKTITLLLIAAVVFLSSCAGGGCGRVSSDTAAVDVTQTEAGAVSVASDNPITAFAVGDLAAIENRLPAATARSGTIERALAIDEPKTDEELGYSYAIDGRRPKPPAFKGVGYEHFARADV